MTTLRLILMWLLLCPSGCVVVCQLCEKLDKKLFPKCSRVIDQTIRLPSPFKQNMFGTGEMLVEEFRGCSEVADLVLCSAYGLPMCVEGVRKPLLPCRRVCDKFVTDCRSQLDQQQLQWFPVLCSLLQNKTKDSRECTEPPDFKFVSSGKIFTILPF